MVRLSTKHPYSSEPAGRATQTESAEYLVEDAYDWKPVWSQWRRKLTRYPPKTDHGRNQQRPTKAKRSLTGGPAPISTATEASDQRGKIESQGEVYNTSRGFFANP